MFCVTISAAPKNTRTASRAVVNKKGLNNADCHRIGTLAASCHFKLKFRLASAGQRSRTYVTSKRVALEGICPKGRRLVVLNSGSVPAAADGMS